MINLFLKRVDKLSQIWFVVPGAVIKGTNLRTKSLDDKVHTIELSDVTIQLGVGKLQADNLVIPTLQIFAWGTDDETFDHLEPHVVT
jgi:hypothetical protein